MAEKRDVRAMFHAAVDRYFDEQLDTNRIELTVTANEGDAFETHQWDPVAIRALASKVSSDGVTACAGTAPMAGDRATLGRTIRTLRGEH